MSVNPHPLGQRRQRQQRDQDGRPQVMQELEDHEREHRRRQPIIRVHPMDSANSRPASTNTTPPKTIAAHPTIPRSNRQLVFDQRRGVRHDGIPKKVTLVPAS
jgi:hypothetical protein